MSEKKIKVALVMGGKSKERAVSLASGQEVLNHIDRNRFEVSAFDPASDLAKLAQEAKLFDLAFLALHGTYGEDGSMQGFCELMGLPYTGSGVLASAMAMDKNVTKRLYRSIGLPVARDLVLTKFFASDLTQKIKEVLTTLGTPVVIKPIGQGSSVGLSIVETEGELTKALQEVFDLDGGALFEQYLSGREFTCGVLGNEQLTALPPIEIIPSQGHLFFDYSAKYDPGEAQEVCPADIPQEMTERIKSLAKAAHQVLACRGLSRSDLIWTKEGPFLLETNTLPGLTSGSLLPKMAKAQGLSFTALISYIIDLALRPGDVEINNYR